jgi:hypothetical protein
VFNLFRRSQARPPTPRIAQALVSNGLPPGMEPSSLAFLLRHGSYAGRRVNYFRVFDPTRVAERNLQIKHFVDLDGSPELVIGSGHVEVDGTVVLSRRDPTHVRSTPIRDEADRSAHRDDEGIVFPDQVGQT